MASERAKRESWMAEQTRAIKESTVRGLEPEIQASAGRRQSVLPCTAQVPAGWTERLLKRLS